MIIQPFTYHSPVTLKEAADIFSRHPQAQILGGGTFFINNLKARKKRRAQTPDHVISLKRVDGLNEIALHNGTLSIGAMVSVSKLSECPDLKDNLAVLKTVCAGLGTTPIRNMATVGGNLASRVGWTEFSTACIALNAQIHLFSQQGESIISAEDFFNNKTPAKGILSKITIKHQPMEKAAYFRIKRMGDIDFPLLAVCINLTQKKGKIENARAVLNTGGGAAHRDPTLESFLNGKSLDPKLSERATDHIKELSQKAFDEYKTQILKAAVQETLIALVKSK